MKTLLKHSINKKHLLQSMLVELRNGDRAIVMRNNMITNPIGNGDILLFPRIAEQKSSKCNPRFECLDNYNDDLSYASHANNSYDRDIVSIYIFTTLLDECIFMENIGETYSIKLYARINDMFICCHLCNNELTKMGFGIYKCDSCGYDIHEKLYKLYDERINSDER